MAPPKGISNNPAGRPKTEDTAAAAIREGISSRDWKSMAVSLMRVLINELGDPNPMTTGNEKAAAYNALTDRAFGRPIQKQIIQEEKEPPIDQEQLAAIRASILGELA